MRGGQLESGCYYLTEDWTLDEPLCVAKNGVPVTLCLNGYSLSLADGAEGCIIYLAVSDEGAEPSVLTITDCNGAGTSSNYYVGEAGELIFDDGSFAWQEAYIAANEKNALAGGRITGATAGAISVGDYNQLYLSGVNIIDNEGRYGAGVVIGETAVVEKHVLIYQCVTLGGTGKDAGKRRHPIIKEGCVISCGAKILGGITVGEFSKVGAGSVVLKDVPPHSTVVGVPGRVVKIKGEKIPDNTADKCDPILEELCSLRARVDELERKLKSEEKDNENI